MKLWEVTHSFIDTDRLAYKTTVVEAPTQEEALALWNTYAARSPKSEQRIFGTVLENVKPLEFLRFGGVMS